jgi:hypothetical protein
MVSLQFDNHANAQDAAKWLAHDREWALAGSDVDPEALLAQAPREEAAMGESFRHFMGNFCRAAGLT